MMEWYLLGFIYCVIGAFAGMMAGIIGIGGGIIVVPGLVFVFQHTGFIPEDSAMHVAAGTSLAVMVWTSIAALMAHNKLGGILWSVFHKLWPGIILGVLSGALIAAFIPTYWLEVLFALFLLFVAYKMIADRHVIHPERFPGTWLNRTVSYFIGFKSGLLGVGGGVLIVPYLTYCGVSPRKIAAISSLCTFTVGVIGAGMFVFTGRHEMASVAYATGYVYWPAVLSVAIPSAVIAPWGAKLSYVLPVKNIRTGFVVILLLTALKMLF